MPHIQKLNGVISTASAVEMAVSDTESSMLALPSEDIKLEMLPPGQAATRIIPSPIIGEIHFDIRMARPQVNAGSRTSWQHIPSRTDLGFLKTSTKMLGLMPRATPYITKARTMLMVFIPPAFIVTWIASIAAAVCSVIKQVLVV